MALTVPLPMNLWGPFSFELLHSGLLGPWALVEVGIAAQLAQDGWMLRKLFPIQRSSLSSVTSFYSAQGRHNIPPSLWSLPGRLAEPPVQSRCWL